MKLRDPSSQSDVGSGAANKISQYHGVTNGGEEWRGGTRSPSVVTSGASNYLDE